MHMGAAGRTTACMTAESEAHPQGMSKNVTIFQDKVRMQDYAVAHEALSLLGTKIAPAREAAAAAQVEAARQRLELSYGAQAAVGAAAVILGVVVIGGWYWRRRRRLQQFV